jgi:hypothetical protein
MVHADPISTSTTAESQSSTGPAPVPLPHRVTLGTGEEIDAAELRRLTPVPLEIPTKTRPPAHTTISHGSVAGSGVTVHRVRVGPKVQQIRVSRSAGLQVGDHNRQLNHYRFKLDRPQVSLDDLLKGHPARLRALERLAANPRSWMANYAFRRRLPTGPTQPSSRVLFAGAAGGPTVRISARVDEYGAMVVENSRGVQVTDHGIQRNDFHYKLAGQEISLERMLRDRPDLVRGLAMTIRHPGSPAVARSFTRRLSAAYTHGSAPSLSSLNQDWPGRDLSVQQGAGVQWGTGNTRTDRVSVDVRRMALTGWEATAERVAARIDPPATPRTSIDRPSSVPDPADLGPDISALLEGRRQNVATRAVTRSSASPGSNSTLSSPCSRRMQA